MEVEDAKRLVRDAIAARIFNDMVSLERKKFQWYQFSLPTTLCKVETREKLFFLSWGEGLGMYGCEESLAIANETEDFCP